MIVIGENRPFGCSYQWVDSERAVDFDERFETCIGSWKAASGRVETGFMLFERRLSQQQSLDGMPCSAMNENLHCRFPTESVA